MNRKPSPNAGFTLLEVMVVITIMTIITSGALYGWTTYRQALHLEQQAELTMTYLRRIQANAYWHNDTRTLRVIQDAKAWCLRSDVSERLSCQRGRAGDFVPLFPDVQLVTVTSPTLAFYGTRNTAQAGHLVLMNGAGRVRLVMSIWGRIRLCSEQHPVLAIPRC